MTDRFADRVAPETYENDETWRLELHRAYNDKAEPIVGRRILGEERGDPSRRYPPVKALHDAALARIAEKGTASGGSAR